MRKFNEAEKQVLIGIFWSNKHYAAYLGLEPTSSVSRKRLENFGETWFYTLKENWDEALPALVQKGLVTCNNEILSLTEEGQKEAEELERKGGLYTYEYDNFFAEAVESNAHQRFCQAVYGNNHTQHGLATEEELRFLLPHITNTAPLNILDVGCGSGQITAWLQQQTQAKFTGIDISPVAIRTAQARAKHNVNLTFAVANMNQLDTAAKYDRIIAVDTLYYAENLSKTVEDILSMLKPGGKFITFFSRWIMEEAWADYLHPTKTPLAEVFKSLGQNFDFKDLSASGKLHWKKKWDVLQQLEADFKEEGSSHLWEYRAREARRYATWPEGCYSRHLYWTTA